MKKKLLAIVLLLTLAFGLTGCGKSTINITPQGLGEYEVLETSSDLVNYSKNDDTITVTVNKDGKYDFVIQDEDGKEYTFTLVYENKNAKIEGGDGLSINLSIE